MRYLKYIVLIFSIFFLNIYNVFASCASEEINELKKQADNIKITYKHLGVIENEYGIYYNEFEVNVKNIPDDFYILLLNDTVKLEPVNGIVTEFLSNGLWNFNIYSTKCDIKIDTIKVNIPRFNKYSLDPLCEGVDGKDFALCGKYYEYDVSYDDFVKRVKQYRSSHNINNTVDPDLSNESNKMQTFFNNLYKFVTDYQLYVIISLSAILILLIVIIINKRKRNRGVLK